MQSTITLYYAPEAVLSGANTFYDGSSFFEPVYMVLKGLNGRKKRFKGFLKKVGKGIKKVAKKSFKVIKKAIPVANAVLTFIPGVGWAAKAALTVAEMGIKFANRCKAKKAGKHAILKSENLLPNQNHLDDKAIHISSDQHTSNTYVSEPINNKPISYTDIVTTQQAYAKKQASPQNIIDITKLVSPTTNLISRLTEVKTGGGRVSRNQMREITRDKVRGRYNSIV